MKVKDKNYISGPNVIKLFSCSCQQSMRFIMLIHVKMPTIFNIYQQFRMVNTTSESLTTKIKSVFFQHFSFYEKLKFHAQLS